MVLTSAALCLLGWHGLTRGLAGDGRLVLVGFDRVGILAALAITAVAVQICGPNTGAGLVLALLLHEAGHCLGARLGGQGAASFRLLPAFGGLIPEDSQFGHDSGRFLHALMGAGLSLGPMVLALTLSFGLGEAAPGIAAFCRAFALCAAMVNTLALLPFRLLDGGRCIEIVARALSPAIAPVAALTAAVWLAIMGLRTGVFGLVALSALGLAFLILNRPATSRTRPMSDRAAQLGFLAYLGTLGAHLAGGMLALQAL